MELWSGYIRNDETGVSLLNEVAEKDAIFQEVQKAERLYWSNPENRYLQLMEQIAELDTRAFIEDAEKRGLQQGIEQGIEKGIEQGIAKGIEKGVDTTLLVINELKAQTSIDEIVVKYHMSVEQVTRIQHTLGL